MARPPAYSPDDEWILWTDDYNRPGGAKIWVKLTARDQEAQLLLGSNFPEFSPTISPNGEWIAYVAENDGDDQVYVQSFPDMGPRRKVSTAGGRQPLWSSDGLELFFRDYESGDLIAVQVPLDEQRPGEELKMGEFGHLFHTIGTHSASPSSTNWDFHPDGDLFVFVGGQSSAAGQQARTVVIRNALTRHR